MSENKNMNACQVCGAGADGYCGSCGMRSNYFGNHILRWILGIIIISWVFSIGMKMGELKAALEASSPYGFQNHMMYRTYPAGGVIQDGNVTFSTSAAVPAMMTGVKAGTVQVIKGN